MNETEESRTPADWIIVMGAAVGRDGHPGPALEGRLETARRGFAAAGKGTRLLLTGGSIRGRRAEAEVMAERLVAEGVPRSTMTLDVTSRDTLQSVHACIAILSAAAPFGRVSVCTDPFHMLRCRLLFSLAGCATEPMTTNGLAMSGPSVLWRTKEPFAIVWDCLLMMAARR